ncbi:MAG TPA: EAL domain-containing protein [Thermomonas sp.]|nr:EAL domain-containing protein [Thermomonas sp.]
MSAEAPVELDQDALRSALQHTRDALAREQANFQALSDEVQRDKTLFRRVQELALIGGWQWNRASDALYLTSEALHILGAASPPTTMLAMLGCLLPDDRQRLQTTLASISEGTGFDLELQGVQADSTPFWVSVIGEPDPQDPAHDRFSGTLQDITDRKRAEAELRHQARTDALTGLLNRDAILDVVASQLRSGAGAHLALLYIDLDRFKIVNDLLGHDAGDQLLVEAAQRIRSAVGHEGHIARFGGDEFLVATRTDTDQDHPERLARVIQGAFLVPFRLGKDDFSVTTSIGISRGSSDGNTSRQLIQNADVAMYESKRRRRNGFHTFSPALAQRQQERLQTETRLRRAVDNNEFHLVYQPQVDLRSGRIFAAEALLRWHNPELGPMAPDRFIDLAESTGEIVRIGRWVLQEACHQMRRWKEQDLPIERVSVNVSYRQFAGENLAGSVQQMLEEAALPGHALELELTERVLVEDAADTSEVFDDLRKLGVRLSIDDFGEGYSALNYLRRLPIHALKLSHGFLQGIPGNKSDEAICQTVVGIARSLGLGMIAEGIETEAQRDHLLRLGVTIGQGFLFAPGLLPGEFGKRLATQA